MIIAGNAYAFVEAIRAADIRENDGCTVEGRNEEIVGDLSSEVAVLS